MEAVRFRWLSFSFQKETAVSTVSAALRVTHFIVHALFGQKYFGLLL